MEREGKGEGGGRERGEGRKGDCLQLQGGGDRRPCAVVLYDVTEKHRSLLSVLVLTTLGFVNCSIKRYIITRTYSRKGWGWGVGQGPRPPMGQ